VINADSHQLCVYRVFAGLYKKQAASRSMSTINYVCKHRRMGRHFTGGHARSHGGAFGISSPQNFFCAPTNFVAPTKICFKHIAKAKILPP